MTDKRKINGIKCLIKAIKYLVNQMISREKFQDSNFSEIDFYLSVKDLDLEIIQDEIKNIQATVLEQVQDYVNQEYLNFLSLSRDLDFVEEELLEYSKDFYKILNNITEFDANLESSSAEALRLLQDNQEQRIQKEITKYNSLLVTIEEIKEISSRDLVKGIVLYKELENFILFSTDLPEKISKPPFELKKQLEQNMDSRFQEMFSEEEFKEDEFLELCTGIMLLESFDLLVSRFRSGVIGPWNLDPTPPAHIGLKDGVESEDTSSGSSSVVAEQESAIVSISDKSLEEWLRGFLDFLKAKVLCYSQATDKVFAGVEFSLLTDAGNFKNLIASMARFCSQTGSND